jgi:integrase
VSAGIYKRGKRYLARIRGPYGQIAQSFTAKASAEAWRRQTMVGLEEGRLAIRDGEVITTAEAERADKVAEGKTLEEAIKLFKKSGECRVRKHYLDHFIKRLGDTPVDEITPREITDALDTLGSCAPATRNRYRSAISRVLKFAMTELHWVDRNVARATASRTEDNARDHVISPEEETLLQAACDAHDERLGLLFALGMGTGARAGELLGLTWKQVDLEAGRAVLPRTKNGDGRTLVIRGDALARLRAYGKVRRIDGRLFANDVGRGGYELSKHFRKVCDDLDTRLAPHVPLQVLAAALGHRTLQMVQRYAHLQTEDLEAQIARALA